MTGIELQVEMKRRGIRQADVANELGMDVTLLSKILTGARPWPRETFAAECEQAIEAVAQAQIRKLRGEGVAA